MVRLSVLLSLASAACGRIGFSDQPTPVADGHSPQVCQTASWSIPQADPDVELATAVLPSGVAVAWVPRAGGSLMAAEIDNAWDVGFHDDHHLHEHDEHARVRRG